MEILDLAQYGLTGVAIATITALVIVVKKVLTLVGNHISHNTEALTKLEDAIEHLIEYLKK